VVSGESAFIGGYLWRAFDQAGLNVVPIETNTLIVNWGDGDYQLTIKPAAGGETRPADAGLAAAVTEITRADTRNLRSHLWRVLTEEADLKVVPSGANNWIISFWEDQYQLTIRRVPD